MKPGLVAVALLLLLPGCRADTLVSGPDECPPNAACGAPPQPDGTSEAAGSDLPDPSLLGQVTHSFDRVRAPDGSATVPLPMTYLSPDEPDDRLIVRVEYPDLCQTLLGVHVVETAHAVTLTAVGTVTSDACPLRLLIATGLVHLDGPLGSRTVTVQP